MPSNTYPPSLFPPLPETTQQRLNAVDVSPLAEVKQEGEMLRVLCRVASPIHFCRFMINGEKAAVLSPSFPHNKFKYFGEGFENGQCGIEIPKVEAIHNGQVSCFLGVQSEEFVGTMNLLVGNAPSRPEMELITQPTIKGAFEANSEFRASCISRNGRPAANITWLLGEQILTNGFTQAQVHEENGLFTVVQEYHRQIQPSDDGLELTCRTEHVSFPNGHLETKTRLNVKCKDERKIGRPPY